MRGFSVARHLRRMDLETHGADGPYAPAEPDAASLVPTALWKAVMEGRVRQVDKGICTNAP